MKKILNFGSLNIDHVYAMDHFVAPGETLSALDYHVFPGGKGLNQSIALARAGAEVCHAGKIGPDGGFLTELLEQSGVNTQRISRGGSVTGHAVIQVEQTGQNCILLHGGANMELTPGEIASALEGMGAGDLLVLQNEVNGIGEMMALAHRQGMSIALNPSPVSADLLSYPLELVTFFLLNEVEGQALTGEHEPERMADALLSRYPKSKIVLTLGQAGVLYRDGNSRYTHGIYRVPAVDTTAAGDTFTGFFLSVQRKEHPIPECLRQASLASALAVSCAGAACSIPTLAEVERSTLALK